MLPNGVGRGTQLPDGSPSVISLFLLNSLLVKIARDDAVKLENVQHQAAQTPA